MRRRPRGIHGAIERGAAAWPGASLTGPPPRPYAPLPADACARPLRLAVQDVALSRRKHGFESRRGHQLPSRRWTATFRAPDRADPVRDRACRAAAGKPLNVDAAWSYRVTETWRSM